MSKCFPTAAATWPSFFAVKLLQTSFFFSHWTCGLPKHFALPAARAARKAVLGAVVGCPYAVSRPRWIPPVCQSTCLQNCRPNLAYYADTTNTFQKLWFATSATNSISGYSRLGCNTRRHCSPSSSPLWPHARRCVCRHPFSRNRLGRIIN